MQLSTKFDVNNLVRHKFASTVAYSNQTVLLEVLEIKVSVGESNCVQTMYYCRPIVIIDDREYKEGKNIKSKKIVYGVEGNDNDLAPYQKYREDELVAAPQDLIDIVLNGGSTEIEERK